MSQKSKNQIVTKLDNSNCVKTLKSILVRTTGHLNKRWGQRFASIYPVSNVLQTPVKKIRHQCESVWNQTSYIKAFWQPKKPTQSDNPSVPGHGGAQRITGYIAIHAHENT